MDFEKALASCTTAQIKTNESLKKHNSLGVGGIAKYYAVPDSLSSLKNIITVCEVYKKPYFILGNGTNVLCSDKGYRGLIISTAKLKDMFFKIDNIRALGGVSTAHLSMFAMKNKLRGAEFLCGIPATVGGAIYMNAGAFNSNIGDFVTEVETLENGEIKKYSKKDCMFGYRESIFKKENKIIISATFSFKRGDIGQIKAKMQECQRIRKNSQPEGKTCGSVFKNSCGYFAGKLIDDLNLKGYCIGGAKISDKHANFIIANKNATSQDVYDLIKYIKIKVKQNYNIDLKEEVVYLGDFDDTIK